MAKATAQKSAPKKSAPALKKAELPPLPRKGTSKPAAKKTVAAKRTPNRRLPDLVTPQPKNTGTPSVAPPVTPPTVPYSILYVGVDYQVTVTSPFSSDAEAVACVKKHFETAKADGTHFASSAVTVFILSPARNPRQLHEYTNYNRLRDSVRAKSTGIEDGTHSLTIIDDNKVPANQPSAVSGVQLPAQPKQAVSESEGDRKSPAVANSTEAHQEGLGKEIGQGEGTGIVWDSEKAGTGSEGDPHASRQREEAQVQEGQGSETAPPQA